MCAAAFFGSVAGRPLVDPNCLWHTAAEAPAHDLLGSGHDHEGHQTPLRSGDSSSDTAPTGSHSGQHMTECLCWFSATVASTPDFPEASALAPVRAASPAPRAIAFQPVPFALPFANGPPVLG